MKYRTWEVLAKSHTKSRIVLDFKMYTAVIRIYETFIVNQFNTNRV